MGLHVIRGSIFTDESTILCHQCNCVSVQASGLARSVFQTYPTSNTYKIRKYGEFSEPGTIDIIQDEKSGRIICNMYAQYHPSLPRFSRDSRELRLTWFEECLNKLSEVIKPGQVISFPHRVGCNMAGGNWKDYLNCLKEFSNNNPHNEVHIYYNV